MIEINIHSQRKQLSLEYCVEFKTILKKINFMNRLTAPKKIEFRKYEKISINELQEIIDILGNVSEDIPQAMTHEQISKAYNVSEKTFKRWVERIKNAPFNKENAQKIENASVILSEWESEIKTTFPKIVRLIVEILGEPETPFKTIIENDKKAKKPQKNIR
jgi:cell fate (sporulation/competence/biofilm development) regulator YmcA (YheA/YmcA/DUF963 family)